MLRQTKQPQPRTTAHSSTPHSKLKRSLTTSVRRKRPQLLPKSHHSQPLSPSLTTTPHLNSTQHASFASTPSKPMSPEVENQLLHVVDPSLIFGNIPFNSPSSTGVSVARYYTNVNATKPREYWDYSHHRIQYHSQDNYDAYRKIGRGKYSEVFAGVRLSTEEPVILKILKPVKKKKIRRELLILQHLTGCPFTAQLLDVVKDPINRVTTVVTRFNEGEDFKSLFPTLSDRDVRLYMYQLLYGLDYAHSRGIMHRDIKPHNLVIDQRRRILRIIDWGLGEFYHPNTEYNCRVASRYFKGPELLLNMKDYDYSVDMWSFGATFAGLIIVVHPFFNGADNLDMINKIARFTGSEALLQYMRDYKIADPDGEFTRLIGNYNKKPFDSLLNNVNKHLATDDAIDLLSKVLVVDHNQRLSAREAMAHPYFDPIRQFANEQHDMLAQQLVDEEKYRSEIESKSRPVIESDGDDEPFDQ